MEFPRGNLLDITNCLRRLADEIDAGEYGHVTELVAVVSGDEVTTHGYGTTNAGASCALLCAGQWQLAELIANYKRDGS